MIFTYRRKRRNTAGFFNRLGALEARATKRAKLGQTLYLPVIFIAYGLLLGKEITIIPMEKVIFSSFNFNLELIFQNRS